MQPPQSILFPVDFSEPANAMVPFVADLARRFGARITLLHAFDLVRDYALGPSSDSTADSDPEAVPYTPAFQVLRNGRQKRLEQFARDHCRDLAATARIEDGDPAAVIQWVARSENTDLIMMPTRGLGTFRRFLLGSVTAKVLHDVDCPVLTGAHDPDRPLTPPHGFHSIVCAVQLNQEADLVLEAAGFLARTHGATVCLVHMESASSFRRYGGQAALETLRQKLQTHAVEATVRVLDAAVSKGIRSTALEHKADLVVIGRGHGKQNLARVWSHLYNIICESPCPVLSV